MEGLTRTVRDERVLERRQVLAGAEMAALCALIARRGLPSPYGGDGYQDGPDPVAAKAFEDAAVALAEKAEAIWNEDADARASI